MRLSTILMLIPVALIAAALGVANRDYVTFRLDPFAGGLTMQLYLLVFLAFFLGVLVGGAVVGFNRTMSRRKRESARHIGEALRQLDGNPKAADQSDA